MKRGYCPHCGTKWLIEKLNYSLMQKMNGYKIDRDSIIIEQSAKKVVSNYTQKCVSCGHEENVEKT